MDESKMTRDDIIKMAREAGFTDMDLGMGRARILKDFAALVAAAEREEIQDEFWMSLQSDLEHGVKHLNEKAAIDYHKNYPGLVEFAGWIRARGKE